MALRRSTWRGHSLLELVVSMSTATILMSGLFGALFIAAQTIDPSSAGSRLISGSGVVAQLLDELQMAISVTRRETHAVAFSVADRDGDGRSEEIVYQWSGQPGDPLTRSYNGGAARTLIDKVQRFSLGYTIDPLPSVQTDAAAVTVATGGATGGQVAATATATTYVLARVAVELQSDTASATRLRSSTSVLDRPEVSGP